MAYRINLKERPGDAIVRIGLEQLEFALKALRHADAASGVHSARKCIKRLRALLRLARTGLDTATYDKLNSSLRDAGRALSATRDHDVLAATLAGFSAGNDAPELAKAAAPAGRDVRGTGSHIGQARKLILSARDDWRHLAMDGDSLETIEAALVRGLRDMRKACDACAHDGAEEEAFHDLRKSVQRHWRHMRLLEAGWPDYFNARAEEAKSISELLGRAQDLALVLRHLKSAASSADAHTPDLASLIEAQRRDLRAEARIRLRRLLDDKPRRLGQRAMAYWTAARRLRKKERAEADHAEAASAAAAAVAVADRPPSKRSPRTASPKPTPRRPRRKSSSS